MASDSIPDIRIVLVEPSHPGNIGAVARAMMNMDLTQLVLVRPREFPHPEASARAAGAEAILARARVVATLEEAIADCGFVAATTARDRASNLPDVPTVIESGLPGYEVTSWNGLAVKAGTPTDIVTQLNQAVIEALKSPEVQKFSNDAGMDARGMSSEDLRSRIKSDVLKWSQVIATAGIAKR